MTTSILAAGDVAQRLESAFPGVVIETTADAVTVPAARVVEVGMFLRDDAELDAKFLNTLLGVDWLDHFDIVYVLSSLAKNHTFRLKARASHEMPVVPSVNSVWMGANLQEREVYDLMGIAFSDHPNLKRVFLWEGFPGHPLRKDFLALPGGYKPGLQRFPFEFPEGQRGYPSLQDTSEPSAPSVPRLDHPPEPALPINDPDTAERERLAEHARQPEVKTDQAEGAGTDPARAGGTAEHPMSTAEAPRGGSPESEESLRVGGEMQEGEERQS
jgi:NADH-quinone oxidoreductase subunit C